MGGQNSSLGKVPKRPNSLQSLLIEHGQDEDILTQLRTLLTAEPEVVRARKCTSLYLAGVKVSPTHVVDVCRCLLDHGADVNETRGGWTALHTAVENENHDLIRLLMASGARAIYQRGDQGLAPLEFAALHGWPSLRTLAECGVDMNQRSHDNATIGFYVIRAHPDNLATEIIAWAHEHGLDIDHAKEDGHTLLHNATLNGMPLLTAWLIAHGANIQAVNTDGRTPAQEAAYIHTDSGDGERRERVTQCIRLLVEAGSPDPGPFREDEVVVDDEDPMGLQGLLETLRGGPGKKESSQKIAELESRLAVTEDHCATLTERVAKLEQLVRDMIELQPGSDRVRAIEHDFEVRAGILPEVKESSGDAEDPEAEEQEEEPVVIEPRRVQIVLEACRDMGLPFTEEEIIHALTACKGDIVDAMVQLCWRNIASILPGVSSM